MACYTTAEVTVLEWNDCHFCKTIKHNQTKNTPTILPPPAPSSMILFAPTLKHSGLIFLCKKLCSRWWICHIINARVRGLQVPCHGQIFWLAKKGIGWLWMMAIWNWSNKSSGWPSLCRQQNCSHKKQKVSKVDQPQWSMPKTSWLLPQVGRMPPLPKGVDLKTRATHLLFELIKQNPYNTEVPITW